MVIPILSLAYNMGLHYLMVEANPPPTSFQGEVDRGWGLWSDTSVQPHKTKISYPNRKLLPTLPNFKK